MLSALQGLSLAGAILVAVLHVYFFVLESFLWTRPYGMKAFRMDAEKAEATRVLAANQGVYNGFLAAGLFWSMGAASVVVAFQVRAFFLACVIVAALVGWATVGRKILFVQGVPAILTLIFHLVGGHQDTN